MADQTNHTTTTSSGSSSMLAFVVGILVVVVGVLAWVVFGNGDLAQGGGEDINISIEGTDTPLESAAEAVSE
ncbi:hypothetical protein R5H30_03545 [Sulfitobacter sp. D35]|uniref:hypothetical protein n=1 Tax=Sulfitobacter sp. D35 TaxID=3083252 RepID=UPI00296E3B29|nr:hypothetical protein [Sulfitobacter sp. D35]MDW4497043.1 hypothetical protein [Sulfitobacter sp. D35]